MAEVTRVVGIDVGKDRFDVSVHPDGTACWFVNDTTGIAAFVAWLDDLQAVESVMEASGGYERAIVEALDQAGHVARVVDPLRVRQFARAAGRRAKNDRIDAVMIARFGASFPEAASVRDKVRRKLDDMVRYRGQLMDDKGRLERQTPRLSEPWMRAGNQARLKDLSRRIAACERRMAKLIAAEPRLAALDALLRSVPGVGAILSAALIGGLPELGHTDRRSIAALVGLAPFDDDTAGRQGQRHVAGGRKRLRNLLYMASLAAATQHNPRLGATYRRLVARGKNKKLAVVAVMRKLLVILNAMVASGTSWRDPEPDRP